MSLDTIIKVAGLQQNSFEDWGKTISLSDKLFKLALQQDVKIIILGELFHTPWFPIEENHESFKWSETLEGRTIQHFQELALKHKVVVVLGLFEKASDQDFYDSSVVIGVEGEILGVYRKMHIPDLEGWREKFYFKPSETGFPVIKTPYLKIGIQICWDNFYPEGSRILAIHGAQLLICPTSCAAQSQQRWQTAITANAIYNNIFAFRLNRAGKEKDLEFYGSSFCVDPDGNIIAGPSKNNPSVVLASLNLSQIKASRQAWNYFSDRRPNQYREITKIFTK